MKSLNEYLNEKLVINKNYKNYGVNISSDKIELTIPNNYIDKCAELIKDEINKQAHNEDINDYGFNVLIPSKKLNDFVVDCTLVKEYKKGQLNNFNYYIEGPDPCMNEVSTENKQYIKLVNIYGPLFSYKDYKFDKEYECGWCAVSTDPNLDAYWVQHYARGHSLHVVYDPKQMAIALIIDYSFRNAKANH